MPLARVATASRVRPAARSRPRSGFIDGKWKDVVQSHLLGGTLRFNQIRRLLPSVTQRMLTDRLRELEADGLVARRVYAQVPPKVEYSLTERGRTLEPVLLALKAWGDAHAKVAGDPVAAAKAA